MDKASRGNCYKDAFDAILMDPQYRKWTLVHGIVMNTSSDFGGQMMGHAWLESPDGETVYDAASGKEVPKDIYYAIGKIDYTVKYSLEQAKDVAMKHMHYGPWDKKIKKVLHYGDNGPTSKVEQLITMTEIIRKVPGKNQWRLYSKKTGKVLGTHNSRAGALRQERAIQISKHRG